MRSRRGATAAITLALAFLGAPTLTAPVVAQPAAQADSIRRVGLDEAVQIALERSPTLVQARANLQSANEDRTSAYGSFLPNVNLSYGYSTSSSGRLDPTGQAITRTSYSTGLSASMSVFEGFRKFHELDRAKSNVLSREATYEQRRFETILNVKTTFYNAVAARERVRVEQDRVDRQREQLQFTRQQIRLGRATRSDTLTSRVDLNDAQLALLNARNDARSAEFALAESMGLETAVTPAEEASLEPDSLGWEREDLMRVALRRAPSVQSASYSVEAAEASIASAKSAYLPSFSLSGGYDWQSEAFPPENRSWSVRVSGSLPLFNGLQRETSIDRAQVQAEAARSQQQAAILSVRTNVNDAYNQVETAQAGLALARESVELARENLRVAQQRYRLGVATILDLRAAQISLQQAQVDLIRREFDVQVGLARLESLLGTELSDLDPSDVTTSTNRAEEE